jgi:mono/diheme cytochrome c family protein
MRGIAGGIILVALGVTSAWAGAAEGKAIYERACRSCHGADGAGNANVAKMLKAEIPALSSAEVQSMSDADLKAVVTNGKGKMRPVTSVTGNQVDDVIAYVRTLKK